MIRFSNQAFAQGQDAVRRGSRSDAARGEEVVVCFLDVDKGAASSPLFEAGCAEPWQAICLTVRC